MWSSKLKSACVRAVPAVKDMIVDGQSSTYHLTRVPHAWCYMPDVIAKGETLWFNAVLLLPSDLVFSAIPRDLIFQESKAEGEKSQF